jgi:hypothetical protein
MVSPRPVIAPVLGKAAAVIDPDAWLRSRYWHDSWIDSGFDWAVDQTDLDADRWVS